VVPPKPRTRQVSLPCRFLQHRQCGLSQKGAKPLGERVLSHDQSVGSFLSALNPRSIMPLCGCRYSFTSRMTSLDLKALSVPLTCRKIPLPVEIFLYS
jgi:hypothetical protein